jgi:hypothetical protein
MRRGICLIYMSSFYFWSPPLARKMRKTNVLYYPGISVRVNFDLPDHGFLLLNCSTGHMEWSTGNSYQAEALTNVLRYHTCRSSHPSSVKNEISYGLWVRAKRIRSNENDYQIRRNEIKNHLLGGWLKTFFILSDWLKIIIFFPKISWMLGSAFEYVITSGTRLFCFLVLYCNKLINVTDVSGAERTVHYVNTCWNPQHSRTTADIRLWFK